MNDTTSDSLSLPSILVVDDIGSNLVAVKSVLADIDARLLLAESGEQALEILLREKSPPALALLDVQMPMMDGYELATLLRSQRKTKSMPIIFLSAVFRDVEHVSKGYQTGAVDFLTKPFDPYLLLSKVRVFLELHRYRQQSIAVAVKAEQEILTTSIMASSPTPLMCVDANGRVEVVNAATRKLLGSNLKGKYWYQFFEEEGVYQFSHKLTERASARMNRLAFQDPDKFQRLFLDAPVAALMADHLGKIKLANAELYQLFGYAAPSLTGKFIHTLLPENQRQQHVKQVEDYSNLPLLRKMGHGRVLSAMTMDGSLISVEVGLFPVLWNDVKYTVAIVLDTNAKQKWPNTKLTPFGRLFAEEEEEEEEVVQVERVLTLPAGRRPVALSIAPFKRSNGSLRGAVLSLMDLSGIREREVERLEMIQRMEKMQRMESLGQLAAGVAHDFNNLLGVMQSHMELIEIKTLDLHTTDENVKTVIKTIERASEIVKKLTSLGQNPTEQDRPFRVGDVIDSVASLLAVSMRDIELIIEKNNCDHGFDTVMGDSGLFEQVLVNLCVNAKHALNGNSNGRVVLRLTTTPDESSGSRWVELEVEDNGCGIPADIIHRIFEPFFTTREVGDGSGLGLSMAYGIIRQMGGAISCKSTVGVGTCFLMKIPAMSDDSVKS